MRYSLVMAVLFILLPIPITPIQAAGVGLYEDVGYLASSKSVYLDINDFNSDAFGAGIVYADYLITAGSSTDLYHFASGSESRYTNYLLTDSYLRTILNLPGIIQLE